MPPLLNGSFQIEEGRAEECYKECMDDEHKLSFQVFRISENDNLMTYFAIKSPIYHIQVLPFFHFFSMTEQEFTFKAMLQNLPADQNDCW